MAARALKLTVLCCLVGLISYLYYTASAGRTSPRPARYQVTVWVVHPLAKSHPTRTELERDESWYRLENLQDAEPITQDEALLQRLRQGNPHYGFSKIEAKQVRTVADGETWEVPLKTSQFQIRVCESDHAQILQTQIRKAPSDQQQMAVRMMADWIALETRGSIPTLNAQDLPVPDGNKLDFHGYRFVRPRTIHAVLLDIPMLPGNDTAKPEEVVPARADMILFTVTPVKDR